MNTFRPNLIRTAEILKCAGVELEAEGVYRVLKYTGNDPDYAVEAFLELKARNETGCTCICHQPGKNVMHVMDCCSINGSSKLFSQLIISE